MAIDDVVNPGVLSVWIKQSKTDPFRQGVTIFMGKTGCDLCPVAAVLAFLAMRGPGEGPLFRFESGEALTRPQLVSALRKVLAQAGFQLEDYAGHSFRIGAAITAAVCGVPVQTPSRLLAGGRARLISCMFICRRSSWWRLVTSWWPSAVSIRAKLSDCCMHGRDASHVCFAGPVVVLAFGVHCGACSLVSV